MHGLTHFQQAYHQKPWVRLPNWPVYCRMEGTKIIYCYWVRVNFCLEVQSYPSWYLCNTILTHKTWGKSWRRGRKILRPRCPGCLLLDTVSASHNKRNTHKISTIWLPEQNQHKDTTHWQVNTHREKFHVSTPRRRGTWGQWLLREGGPGCL